MEAQEVVGKAKEFIQELFVKEGISNLGLEEIEFDEAAGAWSITVGFSRPWEMPQSAIAAVAHQMRPPRDYKIIRICDKTGRLLSVKNREPAHAA